MCCIVEQDHERGDKKLEEPDDAKNSWEVSAGEWELSAKAVGYHHDFAATTIDAVVVESNTGGNRYDNALQDHYQVKDTLPDEGRLVELNSFYGPGWPLSLVSSDEICEFKMCVAVLAR